MSNRKVVKSAVCHRMIDRLNDSLDRREGRLAGMEIRARALMELDVLIQQAKEAANDETEKDATTDG